MDFAQYTTSAMADATTRIDLWDKQKQQDAEHEGKKMYLVIKSDKSPEYKNELNKQINAKAKASDEEFDLDDQRLANGRLCAAITVEAQIYFKKQWIQLDESTDKEGMEKAKKQLREFFTGIPEMAALVKKRMENDAYFLQSNDNGSLIEHDNSAG